MAGTEKPVFTPGKNLLPDRCGTCNRLFKDRSRTGQGVIRHLTRLDHCTGCVEKWENALKAWNDAVRSLPPYPEDL